ncbi:MAG: vitamin K epoxide reductase family protein [Pyrinomonadaceae bacterium]|nr:vitamin K epoxide reductase family protein [Pyrinomonadaceae bacterium]
MCSPSEYSVPDKPEVNIHHRKATLLYSVAALVSLAGLADSIYLTVEHVSGRSVKCTIVSGCSEVLSSPYATVRGIPLALIGATAYFSVFSLATLAAFDYRLTRTLLTILVGLMFLTTLWLIYVQAFVIGHFCQFCLLSAIVTTIIAVLVVIARKREAGARTG